MNFFQNIFGRSTELKNFLDKGAIIVDVRTSLEFSTGHIKDSKNIPLDMLENKLDEIKSLGKPIVTVCQSGIRSGSATSFLQRRGIEVMNGGSWFGVKKLVQ